MADNYLERRMEDYRSGKLSVRSPHHAHGKSHIAGSADLSGLRVIVTDGRADSKEGSKLAQASGAQFHPVRDTASADALSAAVSHVTNRWGGVDVIIDLSFPHFAENTLEGIAPHAMKISLTAPITDSAPGVLGAILGRR